MGIGHSMNIISATLVSTLCLWRGTQACQTGKRPDKVLELYDMEGCPYCRLVREALTELDLEVMIYPCPKGGSRFRQTVEKMGGKQQFPFFVDPNTGVAIYESRDIIKYLFNTYGEQSVPLRWRTHLLNQTSSMLGSLMRAGAGVKLKKSVQVKEPLELYSFESSPYARPVKELLCQLEMPYLLHNVGKTQLADYILPPIRRRFFPKVPVKGQMRKKFYQRAGQLKIPYLVDPNTGRALFESADILEYLNAHYGLR
jgi:glutathione S-transferase